MPIYDYRCNTCDEVVYKNHLVINYRQEVRCPKCDAVLVRLFPKSTFRLKGGGWADDSYSKPPKEGDK